MGSGSFEGTLLLRNAEQGRGDGGASRKGEKKKEEKGRGVETGDAVSPQD